MWMLDARLMVLVDMPTRRVEEITSPTIAICRSIDFIHNRQKLLPPDPFQPVVKFSRDTATRFHLRKMPTKIDYV
jgi:hypothetical protein